MNLASFNAAPEQEAVAAMLACCASRRFAAAMAARRPYPSLGAALSAVETVFESLTWDDTLEAMNGHPRIGARVSGQSAAEQSGVADASLETVDDLRRTVRSYAETYAQKVLENEDLVRTFMGELKRHLKLSRRLFVQSAKPVRQKFIGYLQSAQKARLVRKDLDPAIAADALTGMLMGGALRRPLTEAMYSNKRYVQTCVELFLKGIEA